MTITRYRAAHGALSAATDGDLVTYDDAKRDIDRLGNLLYAASAALHAEQKQRAADIKRKDELIAELRDRMHRAAHALGYADEDPDAGRT